MTELPIRLVIFDCDGVLIDSEPVSRRLLAEEATALGWPMAPEEARRFTGLTWSAIKPAYEAAIGRELPADWPLRLQARLTAMLARGVLPVEGAGAVLEATLAMGLPFRVASNSSHGEMEEKFAVTGLAELVAGRVHSAQEVARGKPAPDVFLAAASAAGVAPECCLVVEDSGPGLEAARAAGMRAVAFAPEGEAPGQAAFMVRALRELPALFRSVMLECAA